MNEDKLNALEREVTRLAGEVKRLSAENDKRAAELIALREQLGRDETRA